MILGMLKDVHDKSTYFKILGKSLKSRLISLAFTMNLPIRCLVTNFDRDGITDVCVHRLVFAAYILDRLFDLNQL